MDLEKRLQGLTIKGDKLARDAWKIMNQLLEVVNHSAGGHPLAAAQSDEIDSRLEIFQKAGQPYQEDTWKYNSRTAVDAKV